MLFLLLFPFFIFIFAYFFPYFWAMAISSVMSLNIKLKFQILLSAFLFVFVGFCAVYCYAIDTDHTLYLLFLAGYVIGTPLWVLRFYLNERTSKVRFYIGLVATLFIIWEMEVPQQIIFHALTKDKTMYDIEIVDELFDGNTTSVTYGYSENRKKCIKDIFSCPFIPLPKQLQYHFFTTRNGKEIVIANVYGPYYGKSLLLNYFENLNITHSTNRAFSLNSLSNKEVFEHLKNLKLSQKGENNGNN